MNISIYVVTHNLQKLINEDKIHKNLIVGNSHIKINNQNLLFDSIGDNISCKNQFYCELTGTYWIWKNSTADIVGLEHYRRFFKGTGKISQDKQFVNVLSHKEISDLIKTDNDIIVASNVKIKESVGIQFASAHGQDKYDLLERTIKSTCKDYLPAFYKVMNRHQWHPYNMLICHKNTYDKYCSWLFPLLQRIEYNIDLTDPNNNRIIGYFSERMLDIWLCHNENLNIIEKKISFIGTKKGIKTLLRKVSFRIHSLLSLYEK